MWLAFTRAGCPIPSGTPFAEVRKHHPAKIRLGESNPPNLLFSAGRKFHSVSARCFLGGGNSRLQGQRRGLFRVCRDLFGVCKGRAPPLHSASKGMQTPFPGSSACFSASAAGRPGSAFLDSGSMGRVAAVWASDAWRGGLALEIGRFWVVDRFPGISPAPSPN